jgi:hypothetical protein
MTESRKMTPHQIQQRGTEARRIIDSDVFKTAMNELDNQIIQQWKACPVTDREGQVLLLQLAKIKAKFESVLIGMIENGKMAEHQININAERNESKARQFFRRVA